MNAVPDLDAAFERFGDRTSSLASLGPGFASFAARDGAGAELGIARYVAVRGALVAATEPLAAPERRAGVLAALAAHCREQGLRLLAMPVGAALAGQARGLGLQAIPIGAEPVFELAEYFSGADLLTGPLARHPLARALLKRGAEVFEAAPEELAEGTALRAELDEVAGEWLSGRDCLPLGFLASVEPFARLERRRYFVLRARGRVQAFLAASPVLSEGRAVAWYFQDLPRRPDARAGSTELLMIQAMRLLWLAGEREVRLGMAPLASLPAFELATGEPPPALYALLGRVWTLGYNFRSLHEFKLKLAPTRLDPLYLVASQPGALRALADAARAHFPQGLRQAGAHLLSRPGNPLALAPEALKLLPGPLATRLPAGPLDLLRRTWLTCCLSLCFIALHLGRLHWPPLQELFAASGYVPGNVTWQGIFLGPLFHNHWFHLTGDQLSFVLFGGIIELLLGRAAFLALLAAGLWLSNPLTHLVCWALLAQPAPQAWAATLAEIDYGSSNAVFAFAGALSALLAQGRAVLIPFALYGLFICYARHSWLALHHLLTLAAGWLAIWLWMRWQERRRERQGAARKGR